MRIIFHVGMGKTGTSSIQAALAASHELLRTSRIEYLGLWLNVIDPKYRGYSGYDLFVGQETDGLVKDADKLFDRLRVRECDTFIYSNESIYGNILSFTPFLRRLQERGATVEIVIYVRPMNDWLPSAFVQWNAYHKTHSGPIRSFGDKGRELAALYNNILLWLDEFDQAVTVRKFDKGSDILDDFSELIGVSLNKPTSRVWERIDDAEAVLRSIFNDRIDGPALPDAFESVMGLGRSESIRSISDFAQRSLDVSEIDKIILETESISDSIARRTGVRVSSRVGPEELRPVDYAVIRERILDYLLEVAMSQAARIKRLEDIVHNIEGGGRHDDK